MTAVTCGHQWIQSRVRNVSDEFVSLHVLVAAHGIFTIVFEFLNFYPCPSPTLGVPTFCVC